MPLIQILHERFLQPAYPEAISALAENPYSVWLPGFGDVQKKADGGYNADTVTPIGRAYTQANGSAESDVLSSTTTFVGSGGGFSMLVPVMYGPNLGSGQGAGVAPLGGALGLRCAAYLGSAGSVAFDYGGATEGATRVSAAVPTSDGTLSFYLFTTGARGMEIWRNGQLLASNTANPTRPEDNALDFVVGDCYGGFAGDAKYALVAAWQKQISYGTATILSRNPWQIFEPEVISVYYAAVGDAALAGNAAATATASGTPSTAISMTGGALQVVTATGTSTTSLALSGTATLIAQMGGDPTFSISLNGAILQEQLAQAALTTGIDLLGAGTGDAAMIGALSGDGAISGNAAQQSIAAAEITVIIALAGAPIAQALAAANLTAGGGLEGIAQQQSGMTGGVLTGIAIAGTPQAYASGSGNLGTILQISGAMLQVNSATGTLTAAITVRADALQQALMAGDLTVRIAAVGAALQQAAMSGALNGVAGYVTPAVRTLIVPRQKRTIIVPFENRSVAA